MSDSLAKELDKLIAAAGLRVTFDPKRSIALPCVFCRAKDVSLVRLGRLKSGMDFTRPVCAPCKAWEERALRGDEIGPPK